MQSASPSSAALRNRLLLALSEDSRARLLPRMRLVPLHIPDTLHAAEAMIEAVYFPESGWVSLVADLINGARTEVGLIGREGMVGLPAAFGTGIAVTQALVQGEGFALRMEAGEFRRSLDEMPELRAMLHRFGEAFATQVTQTAACNGHHNIEQRLARWLLVSHDRVDGDQLVLTHEFLSTMLCAHRPSVTLAARTLQHGGLIRYANGRITVTDRAGLEEAACECYVAVSRQYERILG